MTARRMEAEDEGEAAEELGKSGDRLWASSATGHATPEGLWDMLDISLLASIARQLMSAEEVEVEGKRLPVRRTSSRRLRMVTFTLGDASTR